MSEFVIETHGLSKSYGGIVAVDSADLNLRRGEILGFVGPNGAGKSTFMKLLLGVARPTGGTARVLERDIVRESEAIRARVGYLPGDLGFYRGMRASAFLEFCLSFYRRADRDRAASLARQFDLPLAQRIKGYSTGMRQKLGLVQALSCGAQLLILDEPTKGLDPTSQAQFQELLDQENARGSAVLLSSHVLEEVERMCHRIEFIDRGHIIDADSIRAIRDEFRRSLRVTFPDGAEPDLTGVTGVTEVSRERGRTLLRIDGPVGPVLEALARLNVESLEYNRPDLQEIYHAIYLSRHRS